MLDELKARKLARRAHEMHLEWIGSFRNPAAFPALEKTGVERPLRGAGLMIGVGLDTAAHALRTSRKLLERGWIVLTGGTRGDTLTLTPPLNIDEHLLAAFAEALADCL
jgi:4-aminobutyrate aminotransferase/(S)-3-amino-2-methylpropionate transaminase